LDKHTAIGHLQTALKLVKTASEKSRINKDLEQLI
jgi:hypothetical protein